MSSYGSICTEFYDADKPTAPPESLSFYLGRARAAGGRVLEPMCGSGRYLLPMTQSGIPIDGVDSSPAMLGACLAHARRLGITARVHLQEVASLQLPHRYAMVFVPSGSIGLITADNELRVALSRIRSHMEPGGRLLLELAAQERAPSKPTVLEPRTIAGRDGALITYSCTVSESAGPDLICFSGQYDKRAGGIVVGTEREELVLRMYGVEHIVQELATAGFRCMAVSTASDLPFLAESGCTLVEASADA